jgi:hypothetical protein
VTWLWLVACAGAPSGYRVAWSFANIEEGYDHDSRTEVWVDGVKAVESSVTPQSKPNEVTVDVPAGTHQLRVVNLALYEGQWEEHTVANNYSIDCTWEGTVGPKGQLVLLFDVDQGTVVVKQK